MKTVVSNSTRAIQRTGYLFHELVPVLLCFLQHIGGNVLDDDILAVGTVEVHSLLSHHVNEAFVLVFQTNGKLVETNAHTKPLVVDYKLAGYHHRTQLLADLYSVLRKVAWL